MAVGAQRVRALQQPRLSSAALGRAAKVNTPPPAPPVLPKVSGEPASIADGVTAIALSDGKKKSSLQRLKLFGKEVGAIKKKKKLLHSSELLVTPRPLVFTAAAPLGKSLPLFAIQEITQFFSATVLSLTEQN